MPRVTVTPGRDLDKPLVEIDKTASFPKRLAMWLFRGYLAVVIVVAVLCVVVGVVTFLTF